jgi:hypothetical protein
MKKTLLVLTLSCIVLLVAFGMEAKAQIPKEGTISVTTSFSCTLKALPMGQESVQFTYECMGVQIGDTPEDLFHNASIRCLGAVHVVKGEYDDDRCFCVSIRPDGDQIFTSYKGAGKLGGMYKGTITIVGGTGKLVGIQGSVECKGTEVRPAAQGSAQFYDRDKGHYKLP